MALLGVFTKSLNLQPLGVAFEVLVQDKKRPNPGASSTKFTSTETLFVLFLPSLPARPALRPGAERRETRKNVEKCGETGPDYAESIPKNPRGSRIRILTAATSSGTTFPPNFHFPTSKNFH